MINNTMRTRLFMTVFSAAAQVPVYSPATYTDNPQPAEIHFVHGNVAAIGVADTF